MLYDDVAKSFVEISLAAIGVRISASFLPRPIGAAILGLVHSTGAIVTVYFLPSFKVMTNLASS